MADLHGAIAVAHALFACADPCVTNLAYHPRMAVGAAFLQYVLEQVERTGRITQRKMFGAVGLYCDEVFFAVIDDDTLFFKTSEETRPDYLSRGMKPFMPYKDKPDASNSYFTVPADIIEDAEELVVWARRSVAAAAAKKKVRAKAPSPKNRKRAK
jgi:DNA transformation protein and related proteins